MDQARDRPSRLIGSGRRAARLAIGAGAVLFALSVPMAQQGDGTTPAQEHAVPLFTSASNPTRQGFARIINHSSRGGEVGVQAYDDEGQARGPLTLSMDANETVHFNSTDLENGNPGKGLAGSTGQGQGDWRLVLTSALDIEVLSYIRTTDGFLTAMHDTGPVESGRHDLAIFNPGSNLDQESLLRLSNPGEEPAEISVAGLDDAGRSPDPGVSLTIPAGASRTYTAAELESGDGVGLEGSLGDGTGKWRLTVESTREIVAMSLLSSPTGHLTNLSTAPDNETDGTHRIPLFPAASDPNGRQGFARVMNRADTAGSVTIRAFEDTDREYEALTLAVGANETKHFNSDDLELGNAAKGLTGNTGAGEGDWRLEFTSDLEIDVLSYVRTTDGFLTAMHDTVPPEGTRHRVAVFNPGSNVNQASRLRLVNAGEDVAEVTVVGIDDAGETSHTVSLSVPPGTSRSLSARELETGGEGFDGMLGDGAGKWQLDIGSTQRITVMSLLSSPTGHLTNLSTAPAADFAPAGDATFRDRFLGGWVVARDPESRVRFHADGRFDMTDGTGNREGDYTYTRTGRNGASVVLDFDEGNRCTYQLAFASRLAGRHTYTCDDGESGESVWHADASRDMVGEPPAPFDLDAANGDPVGIGHADGLLYVPDVVDGKVYVYTTEGERRADADFTLDADNDDPTGIAHADGRLYVVDDEDAKVYAYRISGGRDAGSDFELDEDNERPEGMTHADGRFHVVDDFGDVFAYRPGGTRDPDADFELDPSNLFPAGITHAEGRFFVVDWLDEKVYAYAAAGERAEASDFDLYPEASFAAGIAHDGVWFYVVDDILYRVWAYSGDERAQEGPDVSVSVSETAFTLAPEASFELAVAVRNEGDDASPATVLRYYSSGDDSITSGDTELGSEDVDGLEPAESREYAIELTAPVESGVYHYGACVDPVEGELPRSNNCSDPLEVTVSAQQAPEVRRIELPEIDGDRVFRYDGIAYADGVLYALGPQGGGAAIRMDVHGYAVSGERRADLDFDLDADNDHPERLAHADGKLYVIDEEDGRAYAYSLSGGRVMGADFALDPDHVGPAGIAYADGLFYVVDERFVADSVLAYTASGERATGADFDLHDDNGGAVGITHANGRLYVVDIFDSKVFAYTMSGERDPGFDFALDEDNTLPRGLAYANGSFYVCGEGAIFVYTFGADAGVTAPDLAVDVPAADRRMVSGATLTVRATVLNQGDADAPATTLRYYRSTDTTIEAGDAEAGTSAVDGLASATSSEHSLEIRVPTEPGTYYYGACADALDGERDTENNCSAGMPIEVGEGGGPDLVAELPEHGLDVWARYSFGLVAAVRNRGDGGAEATELRYFRSSDATVTTDDAEVAAATVDGLAAGSSGEYPVRITAPSESGTYYYGACVGAVDGESDTENNCSAGIEVAVSARVEACTFDLDDDNYRAAGVAHANGTLYVANDGFLRKVFAYATSGERDADSDFGLDDDNGSPHRIASANGVLYVVDDRDDKVYAYAPSGERDADAEFDLGTDGNDNEGMAFAGGRFYLVGSYRESVLAYTASGDRDAEADFELDPYNSRPAGITHAGARFFVVDDRDGKVYAYGTAGERDPMSDFDLHPSNEYPAGIAYDGARFHVVDSYLDRMFVYPNRRRAPDAQPCFWEGNSTTREIAENTPAGIDVGAPVTASGGDALHYILGGDDAASFDIVAETGQIRTREGVVYDYETKNRYLVEVGVGYDDDSLDMIDVTIDLVDLRAACGFGEFALRTVSGDGRLTVAWKPLPNRGGRYARVQGYETEIRRGAAEPWTDRRTFIGRSIGGTVYANLENDTEYQVRVRSINAERECGWSTPVSGTPTGSLAPRDDREHLDRFGPHRIGSTDRHYRLLVPGRCRHTVSGTNLDADCTYERTAADTGRIFLEFDDPSKGSCEVTLAYSSLTAGSFVDECFDAGVNTNVPFDSSLRMPELPDGDAEAEVPRAPRTQEEFDVFAWGREDLIPGLGFGCPPVFHACEFNPGNGYTVGRDPETGLSLWTLGEYSYGSTGPSSGVVSFLTDAGDSFEVTLEFESSGNVRATIDQTGGNGSGWSGMPHLDLTLGAPTVLLPIPPSWTAAIAVADEFVDRSEGAVRRELLRRFFPDLVKLESGYAGLNYRQDYVRVGRNRAVQTFSFPRRDPQLFDGLDPTERARKLALNGTEWSFVVTFTSGGGADFSLRVVKDGLVPTLAEGFVDFSGDGVSLEEFPDELQLPDEAPQASGEDVAGVEVAAAASVDSIGTNDLQILLVSASEAEYGPGDWLEPKDGGNQRMMIVAAGETSATASASQAGVARRHPGPYLTKRVQLTTGASLGFKHGAVELAEQLTRFPLVDGGTVRLPRLIGQSHAMDMISPEFSSPLHSPVKYSRRTALDSHLIQLTVVCMQLDRDIPTRGARFFSKAKVAEGAVQLCQMECVLDGGDNVQGCVWACD